MNRDSDTTALELIELGTATDETRGNDLHAIEGAGFMPKSGISNE